MKELISSDRIKTRIAELGKQVSLDFSGVVSPERPLVLLGILKGGFMFLADLVRELTVPVEIEFVTMSSYGQQLCSSGHVEIQQVPTLDLEHRRVLVVEDIADTGRSLANLLKYLEPLRPAEVRVCVFLDKPEARVVPVSLDYIGFTIPDKFVVGYGLDAGQHHRQLPGLFELGE